MMNKRFSLCTQFNSIQYDDEIPFTTRRFELRHCFATAMASFVQTYLYNVFSLVCIKFFFVNVGPQIPYT